MYVLPIHGLFGFCFFETFVFLAGDYHSGYPIGIQGVDTEASAHLNISNLEQNGAWHITSMLGANVNWMSGFYHSKYGNTIGNMWSIYVNQRVYFCDFSFCLLLLFLFENKQKPLLNTTVKQKKGFHSKI